MVCCSLQTAAISLETKISEHMWISSYTAHHHDGSAAISKELILWIRFFQVLTRSLAVTCFCESHAHLERAVPCNCVASRELTDFIGIGGGHRMDTLLRSFPSSAGAARGHSLEAWHTTQCLVLTPRYKRYQWLSQKPHS